MAMTPRQRITAALEHREPDRLPIDFAGTDCSSVHVIAYDRLRKALGLEPGPIRLGCMLQQVVEADPIVQDRLGSDAAPLFFHPQEYRIWQSTYGLPVEVARRWCPEIDTDGAAIIRNKDGVILSRQPRGGYYFDPVHFALADISSAAEVASRAGLFERWDWPAVLDESIDQYAARARALYAATDRAVVALWHLHYLQAGQIMRGYEQFMVDLLTDEPMVRAILDRLHAVYMERTRRFLDAMSDSIDIVFLTDDLGSQQGPMIGPATYRKRVKPYWSELIGLIKRYRKKVLMHACGAVSDFIPDFIDMGVDALNPVQISAVGMSPRRLKRDFGKDIAFWGGGISTQGVLDLATPAKVRAEVRKNVALFAAGGGYVFTPVHNIQADVPAANIIAAYDAARAARF